jgi:hypothetical protein
MLDEFVELENGIGEREPCTSGGSTILRRKRLTPIDLGDVFDGRSTERKRAVAGRPIFLVVAQARPTEIHMMKFPKRTLT